MKYYSNLTFIQRVGLYVWYHLMSYPKLIRQSNSLRISSNLCINANPVIHTSFFMVNICLRRQNKTNSWGKIRYKQWRIKEERRCEGDDLKRVEIEQKKQRKDTYHNKHIEIRWRMSFKLCCTLDTTAHVHPINSFSVQPNKFNAIHFENNIFLLKNNILGQQVVYTPQN